LAATAAGGQHRVLLVDANLGRPRVHRIFDLPCSPGLGEVLVSPGRASEAIRPSVFGNLSVLCAGEVSGKALVDVGELSDALEAVRAGYDLVVFDLPAAGESSFAVCVAGMLDGVILVVEAERVRWEVADRAKHRLLGAKTQLLGTVLNKRRQYGPAWMNRNP
jgi:Mrp family chromosome partitioning ATPase